MVHHMRLEHHLVQSSILVQRISLALWKMQSPIREERLDSRQVLVVRREDGRDPHELAQISSAEDEV